MLYQKDNFLILNNLINLIKVINEIHKILSKQRHDVFVS